MDKFERLKAIREEVGKVRSYAAGDDEITHDDELEGAAIAAAGINATHSSDDVDDIVGGLMGHEDDTDDDHRGYAEGGKALMPSKKNPSVKRWVRTSAVKKIAGDAGHNFAWGGTLSTVLHHTMNRHKGLKHSDDSALHAGHYMKHHGEFVEKTAKKYGLRKGTVAVALAHHAHVEIAKQKKGGLHTASGKLKPFHNSEISDHDFHKNLGGRAKSAFISGMIAHHKTSN